MSDPANAPQVYTINQVAGRTGVSPETLRSWERRHGFPRPSRSGNAYRHYSEADVLAIAQFQRARQQGTSVEQALREIQAPSNEVVPDSPDSKINEFLEALLSQEGQRTSELLASSIWATSAERVSWELLLPALQLAEDQRIGGHLTTVLANVAQTWIKAKLASLAQFAEPGHPDSCVVMMCVDQELPPAAYAIAISLASSGLQVVACNNVSNLAEFEECMAFANPLGWVLIGDGIRAAGLGRIARDSHRFGHLPSLSVSTTGTFEDRDLIQSFGRSLKFKEGLT